MTVKRISFFALWLFIFSMPWERSIVVPGIGAAGTLFGLIAFVAGVIAVTQGGKLKARTPSLYLVLFALFVLWSALSFFWAWNQEGAQTRISTYLQFLVMSWLVWELCRTQEQRSSLLQAYVLGAYIVVVRIVYSFFANPFSASQEQALYRYTGIDDNPNSLATFIGIAIAIAWYLAMQYRGHKRQWLYLAYVPICLMALGLLASRGGMFVGVIAFSFIPLTYGYLSTVRKVVITLLIVSVSVVGISAIPQSNIDRLSETADEITEGNVSNRKQIWEAGLQAFREQPIIGIGIGSFSTAVEQVRGVGRPPHSVYIGTLVELGFIGLVLLLLVITVPVLPLFKLPYRERTLYFVLWLAMLVAFIPGDWNTYKVPWFLLTLFTTSRAYVVLPNSVGSLRRKHHQLPTSKARA